MLNLENIDVKSLALKTSGMSCADLKTLINNTLIYYINRKQFLELEDFIKIINEMNFETIGKKWTSKESAIDVLTHEVGHAVVEFKLTGKWPNVSAIRYGDTYGFAETVADLAQESDDLVPVEEEAPNLNVIEENNNKPKSLNSNCSFNNLWVPMIMSIFPAFNSSLMALISLVVRKRETNSMRQGKFSKREVKVL